MFIILSTNLDCPPEKAWNEVKTADLLRRIAAPILEFRPEAGTVLPERWVPGGPDTFRVSLRLLGILPMGRHEIRVRYIDEERREIYTNERGSMTPVWNHRITMRPSEDGKTIYTDELEIKAGWRTPFVWIFTQIFFHHRQRRWRCIARSL